MNRRDRHNRRRPAQRPNIKEALAAMLSAHEINPSPAELADFSSWVTKHLWQEYKNYDLNSQKLAMQAMNSAPIVIPNGSEGKPYNSGSIKLPADAARDFTISGLEGTGLRDVWTDDGSSFHIEGIPEKSGDFTLVISYHHDHWLPGMPELRREVRFAINPDPRKLWRNIPTPEDIEYYKPDTDCQYLRVEAGEDGAPRKDIVAASNRGRSHAQDGKARDDHFKLDYNDQTGWYIIAVADGAGSAQYSRRGSEIACETVIKYCKDKIENDPAFEAAVKAYGNSRVTASAERAAASALGNQVYKLLGNAALVAHRTINAEAALKGYRAKDFATTLMLAVCKKFDFGWFIASFWVGDGAMCIYNRDARTFNLLGTPDEGEYSGQTRFLTMPEIFSDPVALFKRLRFSIVDDFTALMLMTDGVSDPMFGTDANLNNIDRWDAFYDLLRAGFPDDGIHGVDLDDDNEASKDQLLNWLNYWIPGEHDDRTIAILY